VLRNWNFSKRKRLEENERRNEDLALQEFGMLCALCGKPFFLARIELIDQPPVVL
jgi:hypothetical protein